MIVQYFDKDIKGFVETSDDRIRVRVVRTITILERFGNQITMPYSKKIGDRLFELRTMGNPAVRIFYTFYHGQAILLHGYIKKTQKMPRRELLYVLKKLNTL
ncbi:MAG: type II toxin-antitoxin system RelE/ParE family toxin [Candidatus Uhrbacteria bacterium]|nr:type II toxin-antitoxin system RelE/ParE family toxin [Candidatus Uhrbacteria bacterium]